MPLTRTAVFTASGFSLMNRLSSMVTCRSSLRVRLAWRWFVVAGLGGAHSGRSCAPDAPALTRNGNAIRSGGPLGVLQGGAEPVEVLVETVEALLQAGAGERFLIPGDAGGLAELGEGLRGLNRVVV